MRGRAVKGRGECVWANPYKDEIAEVVKLDNQDSAAQETTERPLVG